MKKIIVLIVLACITIYITKDSEYIEIPSSSIRLRVIANSNSEKDQSEKIIVKNALEEKIYDIISGSKNAEDVEKTILKSEKEISQSIEKTIKENNISSSFTTNYGYNFFPEKEYKGITYSSGNYKSYVVSLGDGEGENWWCVLYPPLCLVDENVSDYEYHSLIKDVLDKYN